MGKRGFAVCLYFVRRRRRFSCTTLVAAWSCSSITYSWRRQQNEPKQIKTSECPRDAWQGLRISSRTEYKPNI